MCSRSVETTDSNLIASGLDELFANAGKHLGAKLITSMKLNVALNYLGEPSPYTFCTNQLIKMFFLLL